MKRTRTRKRQCEKCPWRADVDPHTIPNGYDVEKHRRLGERTIAKEGELPGRDLHIMACHESMPGREVPCVGWLDNQLNDGNNLGLRLAVHMKLISADYELVGEQRARFEDTLPTENEDAKRRSRRRR